MPRTALLRAVRSLFKDAHLARQLDVSMPNLEQWRRDTQSHDRLSPMNRRTFMSAVGVGAASLAMPRVASARNQPIVAIVGAGIAGLTCALKLADRGLSSTVYEASARIGGRMFSNTHYWADGQVSEWCGEFIDSGHTTVQALAKRFQIPLDDLPKREPLGSQDTYYFDGDYYGQDRASSDFLASVAARVAADAEAAGYPTTYASFTEAGAILASMSVYDWIESRVPGGHESALGQLLDIAYVTEYGADSREQSALNLVYLLGYQPNDEGLSIFGESDERYHMRGGNQRLPVAMARHLGNVKFGHALRRIAATSSGRYQLTFEKQASPCELVADYVVLAIPFAVLRDLDYSKAGFDALKHEAIQSLGRGRNAKTQLQFASRVWNGRGAWPGVGNGASYSDPRYQSSWGVTRAQPGARGILAFYSGGSAVEAMTASNPFSTLLSAGAEADAMATLRRAEVVFPGLTQRWNGRATQSLLHRSPLYGASYSYWRGGQYLAVAGDEGAPQGRVVFCGEHTSQDFQGYMEGGASEGVRCARELARVLRGATDALDAAG